jgi:UDP-N-acetylmuramoyl-L-alanyl-D-glutamate--2,6-diaminopimelate ligase
MARPFNEFSYSLSDAAELLGAEKVNFAEVTFTGLTQTDSDIQPGDLFLAYPGAKSHGAHFIASVSYTHLTLPTIAT